MKDMKDMKDMKELLSKYVWRLLLTSVGLIFAILFLTIGFWRTLVVLFCCGIGFAFGVLNDKNISISYLFSLWRNRF